MMLMAAQSTGNSAPGLALVFETRRLRMLNGLAFQLIA